MKKLLPVLPLILSASSALAYGPVSKNEMGVLYQSLMPLMHSVSYQDNTELNVPDPLVFSDGTKVEEKKDWDQRSNEILELFKNEVYGAMPEWDGSIKVTDVSRKLSESGTYYKEQKTLTLTRGEKSLDINVLLYKPAKVKDYSFFVGLNFSGNQSATDDLDVLVNPNYANPTVAELEGITESRFNEKSRGTRAHRFPVELITENGYGLITAYYGDFVPDYHDSFKTGVHTLYQPDELELHNRSALSAWAWGLSRLQDYVESHENNADTIAYGHSRLGKAALIAAAYDDRFGMVISNNSGAVGAAMSSRNFGENINIINTIFPHWFNTKFKSYNNKDTELSFDQNLFLSTLYPRPIHIASASEDLWADPKGEFLSLHYASDVYEFFESERLGITDFPDIGQPSIGKLSYHVREGKHDLQGYDWEQFIQSANYNGFNKEK